MPLITNGPGRGCLGSRIFPNSLEVPNEQKNVVTLEDWAFVSLGDIWTPPECRTPAFSGNAYGHSRFESGTRVTTSPIVAYEPENGCFRTASGSLYRLGTVRRDYDSQFPNAFERLVSSFLREKGLRVDALA